VNRPERFFQIADAQNGEPLRRQSYVRSAHRSFMALYVTNCIRSRREAPIRDPYTCRCVMVRLSLRSPDDICGYFGAAWTRNASTLGRSARDFRIQAKSFFTIACSAVAG